MDDNERLKAPRLIYQLQHHMPNHGEHVYGKPVVSYSYKAKTIKKHQFEMISNYMKRQGKSDDFFYNLSEFGKL